MKKQGKLYPKFLFIPVFILFISGCNNYNNQFSEVTQQFQDKVKGENTICLYPSTLKMLNTHNDPSLNELFKNIKKVKVVNFDRTKDTVHKVNIKDLAQKIKAENYVDLFRLKQNENDVQLFLLKKHDKPQKIYGIISDSTNVVLIDLVGNIPLNKLTALTTGKIDLSPYSSILNFKNSKNKPKNKTK